jgi:hypothetical protein
MNRIIQVTFAFAFLCLSHSAQGVDLQFSGTQEDIGGTFFPTYTWKQNSIVPWRSDSEANFWSTSEVIGQRYYAKDGWALFGTQFAFPDANPGGVANAFLPPEIVMSNPNFQNLINLPSFVTQHQIFSTRIAAGWSYALIDDPRLQAGIQKWTFDGVNYPNPIGPNPETGDPGNITGVNPFVKLGILDGRDTIADTDPTVSPAGRWGFQVGANVPSHFRIGVMTDGLDGVQWAPTEVVLTRLVNQIPVTSMSSGTLSPNRFVDMHFFDIIDAQPGDQFLFSARAAAPGSTAGISGFSFDIVIPFVPSGADFDGDGKVTGRDFLVWQRGDSPNPLSSEDLQLWQNQYGTSPLTATQAVPEPTTVLIFGMALLAAATTRRV